VKKLRKTKQTLQTLNQNRDLQKETILNLKNPQCLKNLKRREAFTFLFFHFSINHYVSYYRPTNLFNPFAFHCQQPEKRKQNVDVAS